MQPATPSWAAGVTRSAAYHHLALTILGLDVSTLAAELRTSRMTRAAWRVGCLSLLGAQPDPTDQI